MGKIVRDDYWDNKSGGVRCSSIGDDANRYHDPSEQHCEGSSGRSLASLLPSGAGVRGVVIPRATIFGGSRGFDAHKPRLVNIDPDIKGQSCVVDLSKIDKEKMAQAFSEAANNPLTQDDIALRASQTYHNLAIGFEPVGMKSTIRQQFGRLPPIMGGHGYVVPRALLGGGQEAQEVSPMRPFSKPGIEDVVSPSITPKGIYEEFEEETEEEEVVKEAEYVAPRPMFREQVTNNPKTKMKLAGKPLQDTKAISSYVAPPSTKVTFEIENWGSFEACFSETIATDSVLVLVYNLRCKEAMHYKPPTTESIMAVRIQDVPKVFFVHSYGISFTHNDYEYTILAIDQVSEVGND